MEIGVAGWRGSSTKCYNCGRFGHMSKECKEPKREKGACYECGKKGHLITACPDYKRRRHFEKIKVPIKGGWRKKNFKRTIKKVDTGDEEIIEGEEEENNEEYEGDNKEETQDFPEGSDD